MCMQSYKIPQYVYLAYVVNGAHQAPHPSLLQGNNV